MWKLKCHVTASWFDFFMQGEGKSGHNAVDDLARNIRIEMRRVARTRVVDSGFDDLNSQIGAEQIASLNGEPWQSWQSPVWRRSYGNSLSTYNYAD
jgi:hypothetical protein